MDIYSSFFVLLTEIFPKATRIGLGLGGGSCKTSSIYFINPESMKSSKQLKETERTFFFFYLTSKMTEIDDILEPKHQKINLKNEEIKK